MGLKLVLLRNSYAWEVSLQACTATRARKYKITFSRIEKDFYEREFYFYTLVVFFF